MLPPSFAQKTTRRIIYLTACLLGAILALISVPSASAGASTYNVKRSTTDGGPYTPIASGFAGTTYVNTGITNWIRYYYVVSAVNSIGGEGPNSPQANAMPVAPGPMTYLRFDESSGTTASDSTGNPP